MAQKRDIAADKARKQKIVLAIAGVALVGLAAFQVPKLMKSDSTPAAAPAAETTSAAATPATAAPTAIVTTTTVVTKPVAFVAGVGLPGPRVAPAAKSQLASFTLFQPSDPFVQQVGDDTGAPADEAAPQPSAEKPAAETPAAVPGDGTAASDGSTGSATQPAIKFATVMLDGKPQQLEVKDKFPKADPMFVLVSLKKKQAKIGVAGGSFDDGETVTLVLEKRVTLLNTATGVRYELKLVYTGSEPETIEGFSTAADQQAATPDGASTVSATPTATAATP